MPESTEENLLRIQQHELRIDAVDLHRAIDQWTHPIVVADRDRKLEFAHDYSIRLARKDW
jgi:hypothetical protein